MKVNLPLGHKIVLRETCLDVACLLLARLLALLLPHPLRGSPPTDSTRPLSPCSSSLSRSRRGRKELQPRQIPRAAESFSGPCSKHTAPPLPAVTCAHPCAHVLTPPPRDSSSHASPRGSGPFILVTCPDRAPIAWVLMQSFRGQGTYA